MQVYKIEATYSSISTHLGACKISSKTQLHVERVANKRGGNEWKLIKILLEGDEDSNKTNTASNTRLRLTTQVGKPT
jgi:hypothetical protein